MREIARRTGKARSTVRATQRDERGVGWNRKRVRAMPACLIEHHHGMVILGKRPGKAVEGLHRRRINIGHHQRKSIVRAWLYRCEDVGEGAPRLHQIWQTRPF